MRILSCIAAFFATTTSATTVFASFYEQQIQTIDGKPLDLSQYKGKVVLVVNVASKCGFTKQYAALEALYLEYKDKGLVILGVPSNDFGGQEPGTPAEIVEFCTGKYGITFPMTEKLKVKGAEAHPLYQWFAQAKGAPKWNFYKYLINKDGEIVDSWASTTKPDDEKLLAAIKVALQ